MKYEYYLVSAHADREVGPPWNDEIDLQIKQNSDLSKEWVKHQRVKDLLAQVGEPSEMEESREQVKARLDAYIQLKHSSVQTSRVLHWKFTGLVAVAALGLAIGGLGYWVGRNSSSSGATVAEVHVKLPPNYTLPLHGDSQLIKMTSFDGGSR